jgi:hypothetical protein
MPASVMISREACRTRSRLRCPWGVLAGPRRRGGGAEARAAGGGVNALLAWSGTLILPV